jgi:hypothetical protein
MVMPGDVAFWRMATQFSGLGGLVGLGERTDVDIRPTLLRVLTDLYMQKPVHSHDEERHYTELALRLIQSVDQPTRESIRARLVAYGAAPRPVLERLLADAAPAAGTSVEDGLMASARAPAPAQHAATPAAASADELTRIFFDADSEERRLILVALHYAGPADANADPMPDAAALAHRLEAAVLQRNLEETIWQLECTLDISRATARRIVSDATGEPFLVAARVIGMRTEVLQRILLFLNPAIGRSVPRVYELARLYEEISGAAAQHLLAIWREADHDMPRRRLAHQPIAREDSASPRLRGEGREDGPFQHAQTRGAAPSPDLRAARASGPFSRRRTFPTSAE